jgi:hypothetical protein
MRRCGRGCGYGRREELESYLCSGCVGGRFITLRKRVGRPERDGQGEGRATSWLYVSVGLRGLIRVWEVSEGKQGCVVAGAVSC